MIEHALWYFKKAKFYIPREGFFRFIKRSFSFLKSKVFLYESHYIFQKSLDNVIKSERFAPKIKNYDFKIISTIEEMHDLLGRGFSINSPFSISSFSKRLGQGQIAFCIFVEKDLANSCWAVMNSNVKIDPPLRDINYKEDAYLWNDVTAPQYRRLGLYTYGSLKGLQYLKEMGKSRGILAIRKDNEPAIRTQKKLGLEICGEGNYLRLFMWTFWKEKSIEKPPYQ